MGFFRIERKIMPTVSRGRDCQPGYLTLRPLGGRALRLLNSALTRRTLLASALLAGCSRKLATRYFGWLFVATAAERGIAVADLSQFRHVTTIPLDQIPGQVLRAGDRVFVTCPEARLLCEIDPGHFTVTRRLSLPGRIVSASVAPDGKSVIVATEEPATLCLVDPVSLRVKKQTALRDNPAVLDVIDGMAVVASASGDSIARVSLPEGRIVGVTGAGSKCGVVRFRKDGRAILGGLPDAKQIITMDAATGTLLARLPLAFAPARFAYNSDGGQMFVTGASDDTLAIVSPYQSEVDQTIIAGRTPYSMAVSFTRNLLLVTNPGSGDLTILDIDTRRLSASVHVGGNPGEVLLTPDEEYALVISRDAGDVAVVRLRTVLDRSVKTKPLFTVIPMGGKPQSALIVPTAA
jgi:YVTN family beta-propeller protein